MASLPEHPILRLEVEVNPPTIEIVDLYSVSVEVDTVAPEIPVPDSLPVVMYSVTAGPPGEQGPPGDQGEPGIQGVPGPPAPWTEITQAAFDALGTPPPGVLYLIIG